MLGCACHAWPTSNKTRLILASQPLLTTCPPPPSSPPSPPSPPSPQCYINAGRWYVAGPKFRNRQRKVRSETVEHCELDTIGQNGPQIGLLKNQTYKRIALQGCFWQLWRSEVMRLWPFLSVKQPPPLHRARLEQGAKDGSEIIWLEG